MATKTTYPVVQQGFDRVAVGILTGDGIDASVDKAPTLDPTDWTNGLGVAGVGILLPAQKFGQRITGIAAACDQGIDYVRGLRVIVVMIEGKNDGSQLASIVQQWPGYVSCYASESKVTIPNLSNGAIVPDVTTMETNPQLGLVVPYTTRIQAPYQVLCDETASVGNTAYKAGNGALPLIYSMDGRLRLTWWPGLYVPPDTAAIAVISSYRPYSGAAPAAATKLVGATIRGSVHGYPLDAPATPSVAFTPSRFGNQAVPGSLS